MPSAREAVGWQPLEGEGLRLQLLGGLIRPLRVKWSVPIVNT